MGNSSFKNAGILWAVGLVYAFAGAAHAQFILSNGNYAITVHPDGNAVYLTVPTTDYTNWIAGNDTYQDRTALTHRVYHYFEDVFDFMFVVDDLDSAQAPFAGQHIPIKNDVSGLGKPVYDNSPLYGSTGVLFSLIHLTEWDRLLGGPSLHEMMHRWANSLDSIPTEVSGHWGYCGAGGQLGGWQPGTLSSTGPGTYDADGPSGGSSWGSFANGGNGVPFSDIELYTAGLLDTNGVTNPIDIAQGFSWIDSGQGTFNATSILSVTISDIVSTDGPRTPGAGTAPTNFRGIVIGISDTLPDLDRLDSLDDDAAWLAEPSTNTSSLYNFFEATRGLGQLKLGDLIAQMKGGPAFLDVHGPNSQSSAGILGGPFAGYASSYTLSNRFDTSITWTSMPGAAWLTVSPSSGMLNSGDVQVVTLQITTNANSLAPGIYETECMFMNTANTVMTYRTVSLGVQLAATLPFLDDFESGVLSNYWTSTGTADYRTEITTNFFPYAGTNHLILEDLADGGAFSRNELTLGINLAGYTNINLSFWVKDYGDESHYATSPFTGGADFDGIAISENNDTWYIIHELTGLPDTNYTFVSINLSAAASSNSLSLVNNFRIRFNQYDNWSASNDMTRSDGLTFDNISITGYLSDRDSDGMSDLYEEAFGLDPDDPGDALVDTDGDLVINLEEYAADTNPTNAGSYLRFEMLALTNQGTALAFPSSSNRMYSLFYSTNLPLGQWDLLSNNIQGSGSQQMITTTNGPSGSTTFRLETWVQD